jgi:NAD(P)-dependent dehydrogenase (short-subunit alcohol dehydrogenase family)
MCQPTLMILGASQSLGCATRARSRTKLHELANSESVHIAHADIDNPEDISRLKEEIRDAPIDLMIVDAGVANDMYETPPNLAHADFQLVMQTNALSPIRALETLEGFAPATFANEDAVYGDIWPTVKCLALLQIGDDDPSSTAEMAQNMADLAPGGDTRVIPGHRQLVNLTAPDKMNRALRGWLALPESGA